MTQKIIQVGKSAAVTLPKAFLKKIGWRVGARVRVETDERTGTVSISPAHTRARKTTVSPEFASWIDRFIETHRPTLEELSKK